MPSKNPTTVVLAEKAQRIKDDLAPIFGLKNILSAALLLFGKLSDTEQKQAITEANGAKKEAMPPTAPEYVDINKAIDDVTYYVKFKLPSAEEQKKLRELRKMLGPESKKQKKKNKSG